MLKRIAFCLCATLAVCAVIAAAQDVPNTVSVQGVLLDGTGNPVTTPVTIRLSFYDDVMDVQPAFADTVEGVTPDNLGRFKCAGVYPVGFQGGASGKPASFIGIGVEGGPEMTPRLSIASVPFSAVAQGVNGDIHTSPGILSLIPDDTLCIDSVLWTAQCGSVNLGLRHQDEIAGNASSCELSASDTKSEINVVATDAAGNKDSCIFSMAATGNDGKIDSFKLTTGGGKAVIALSDGMENYSSLDAGGLVMIPPVGDTSVKIGGDGNARFAGDIQSGNSLILQGNQYRLVSSGGQMYFGRYPGAFSDIQVGVGTQNPIATLHVEGTTHLGGVTTIATGERVQSQSAGGARILGEQGNTAARPAIGFFSTNGVDDGGGGNGIYRPSANAMAFAVQSSERMRVTGYGVGIGSPPLATPASVLDVNGPISTAIATVTGSVTMLATASVTLADNSGGAISVTLPVANTCKGRQVTIKKISTFANGAVTVQRQGTDLIDGATAYSLVNQYDFVVLVSDGGSNWYVVGK